jgi:hypothetical protein
MGFASFGVWQVNICWLHDVQGHCPDYSTTVQYREGSSLRWKVAATAHDVQAPRIVSDQLSLKGEGLHSELEQLS